MTRHLLLVQCNGYIIDKYTLSGKGVVVRVVLGIFWILELE